MFYNLESITAVHRHFVSPCSFPRGMVGIEKKVDNFKKNILASLFNIWNILLLPQMMKKINTCAKYLAENIGQATKVPGGSFETKK